VRSLESPPSGPPSGLSQRRTSASAAGSRGNRSDDRSGDARGSRAAHTKATNATAYHATPVQNEAVMPAASEIAVASTEAHTDVAPFSPHSHGVRAENLAAAARMPKGNAIPMSTPRGNRIAIATRMRSIVVAP